MRIIKPKKQRGRTPLAMRLGIVNTPEQTAAFMRELRLAKAKLARAKKAKPAAKKPRPSILKLPLAKKAVARVQKRKAA